MFNKISKLAKMMVPILVCMGGLFLLMAFLFGHALGATTAALSIAGFVAGGVSLSIGSTSGSRKIELWPGNATSFAAALACGPIGAVGPSFLTGLGKILLVIHRQKPLRESLFSIARLPVQAALAGWLFNLAGGSATSPSGITSLIPALTAAAVYVALDRILSTGRHSMPGVWISIGAGYGLAGAVSVLPAFAVLVTALPLASVLLWMLRQERIQVEPVQTVELLSEVSIDESEGKDVVKPSFTDTLTGAANHRYLEMFLQQEISRSERTGQPITVLLVDIDNFEQLNQAHGEDEADRYLSALTSRLKELVREYDLVARQKDDELVIVLPETSAQAGYDTAQRLHSEVSGKILPFRATFSIGAATYPDYGASIDDLLSSAHHALNRAKFSGKNQIRSCHLLARAS